MKERDELIEEARVFLKVPDSHFAWPEALADFALKVLERESIYREICEAAIQMRFAGSMHIDPLPDGWMVMDKRNGDRRICTFNTLAEAFEFVKGEKE